MFTPRAGRKGGNRCETCQRPEYPHSERVRMARFVAAYVSEHGLWCPGWGVDAHACDKITADHVNNYVDNGPGGPLRALCVPCNSRRNAMGGMVDAP